MNDNQRKADEVVKRVGQVILGKEEQIREIFLVFLAAGHILLEDIPGVGKTTLALAFSKVLGLDYRRVQFTPDVMPSDLTGFSIYSREKEAFFYQPGSVFCNLLLADELNRTSPKTQSALLEVMEEKQCTVEGVTREVPSPFLVIATQNPFGNAGTWRLPEAQTDRFMISLSIGYPDFESELQMAKAVGNTGNTDGLEMIMDRETLLQIQREVQEIYIKDTVYRYILELITATRRFPGVKRGASPRATIALVKMARASAWLQGRSFVVPEDVSSQFAYVVMHRLIPEVSSENKPEDRQKIVEEILSKTAPPPMEEDTREGFFAGKKRIRQEGNSR